MVLAHDDREALTFLVMQGICEISNFDEIFPVMPRNVNYSDIWFTCPDCGKVEPPEHMFFTQVQGDEVILQSFSTFFQVVPEGGGIEGIDEDFESGVNIGALCGSCLETKGISTDDVLVVHISVNERKLV